MEQQILKYIALHMDQIRAFNSMMNFVNITMVGLWIYLIYRTRKHKKEWEDLSNKIKFNESELLKRGAEIKRSNDLFEKHGVTSVYLVWLLNHNQSNDNAINASVGCFRDRAKAETYLGEKVGHIQEIEIA